MSKRRIAKISTLLCFFSTLWAVGQVGINIEQPEADLDVEGSVRWRKLDNPVSYNRMIVANAQGDIGYTNLGDDAYTVKDVLFKYLPQTVSSTLKNQSNTHPKPLVELNLDLLVAVAPYSSTAIAVEYNVSITAVLTGTTAIPGYMGITLMKNENGVQTELEEGSRKFTLYNVPVNYNNSKYITMPVSGKATDILTNYTNQTKYITYSAKGYIENGSGVMYFGNPPNAPNNFGSGVLIVQVYEKRL
ncbi:hypothetical protein ACKUSY_04110 [Myroides odoratus]